MAVAAVAAGVGAAGLITGIVQNKKSQKKGSGEQGLDKLTQALFTETDPIRQVAIQQSMTAMLQGKTGLAADQITLAEHSAIAGNQAKVKQQAERQLGREGLLDSSFGNQQLLNIDEATSQMLSAADTEELKSQIQFGRGVGF